jgi:hypothetical protein
MEQERGSQLTTNRVLIMGVIVVVILLVLASTLGEKNSASNIRGASLNEEKSPSEVQVSRDWVTLLIIPLALAGVGYVYTSYETRRTQAVERSRAQEERIRTFLDEMDKLLIERHLRASLRDADERKLARTRILTVLLNMDIGRKRRPLKAIYELRLVDRNNPIVSLSQADLDDAELSEAILPGIDLQGVYARRANLRNANLKNADLRGAYLTEADLSGANLSGADITQEQLDQVKSLEGTILPDGSTHPGQEEL